MLGYAHNHCSLKDRNKAKALAQLDWQVMAETKGEKWLVFSRIRKAIPWYPTLFVLYLVPVFLETGIICLSFNVFLKYISFIL